MEDNVGGIGSSSFLWTVYEAKLKLRVSEAGECVASKKYTISETTVHWGTKNKYYLQYEIWTAFYGPNYI